MEVVRLPRPPEAQGFPSRAEGRRQRRPRFLRSRLAPPRQAIQLQAKRRLLHSRWILVL